MPSALHNIAFKSLIIQFTCTIIISIFQIDKLKPKDLRNLSLVPRIHVKADHKNAYL